MTAATQPSIEELSWEPSWIPTVNFHNPFLAFDDGEGYGRFPSRGGGKRTRSFS